MSVKKELKQISSKVDEICRQKEHDNLHNGQFSGGEWRGNEPDFSPVMAEHELTPDKLLALSEEAYRLIDVHFDHFPRPEGMDVDQWYCLNPWVHVMMNLRSFERLVYDFDPLP